MYYKGGGAAEGLASSFFLTSCEPNQQQDRASATTIDRAALFSPFLLPFFFFLSFFLLSSFSPPLCPSALDLNSHTGHSTDTLVLKWGDNLKSTSINSFLFLFFLSPSFLIPPILSTFFPLRVFIYFSSFSCVCVPSSLQQAQLSYPKKKILFIHYSWYVDISFIFLYSPSPPPKLCCRPSSTSE